MTKLVFAAAAAAAAVAFATGCYVGWKTTMTVFDSVNRKMRSN